MRRSFTLLSLTAGLMAQEPPTLTTTPPVQTAQFGATALGAGVTEVAQLTFLFIPGSSPRRWYLTATVHAPSSALFQGYTGEATSTTPGVYTVVSASGAELVNVPAPTVDYFAFNASTDRKVLVFDSGSATPPSVFVRTNNTTGTPYVAFGSIGGPVPVGYRDSQLGDTITSWNGTTGVYEYIYVNGNDLAKVRMTLSLPGTVTLGTPVTIATSSSAKHSPSPMRQWGSPANAGTGRALLFSHNTPGTNANSWFRGSIEDIAINPTAIQPIYSDANWKANAGHIGGSTYWAYAVATYQNPLQLDICATGAGPLRAAGGTLTLCGWAPPSSVPRVGFFMLGAPQIPGIDLSFLGIRGRLGINPASLVVLPTLPIDPFLGEGCQDIPTPLIPACSTATVQFGCLELPTGRTVTGSTLVLKAG